MKKLRVSGGKTLQEVITERGYSIRDFCSETGIPKASLYKYISGDIDPPVGRVIAIAKTLKYSVRDVLLLLGKDLTGVPDDE